MLEGNLIFNGVRESGDHGMFNSWYAAPATRPRARVAPRLGTLRACVCLTNSLTLLPARLAPRPDPHRDRQPIVHDATGTGELAINPAVHQIRGNFFMNRNWLGDTRSGYSIDYDDGSSQYNATSNFLAYGAFKVRDGVNRQHSHNLIYGKPADYQCDGFNSTVFEHNTVIAEANNKAAIQFGCVGDAFDKLGSYNSVHQNNNRYFTPNNTALPFSACGKSFAQLQAAGYEQGSTLSADLSVAGIMEMARATLAMQ